MQQNDSDQERSLPATPRRLEQAREEGQVARSRELPGFLLVMLGAAALFWTGSEIVAGFGEIMRRGLEIGAADAFDSGRIAPRLGGLALDALVLLAPFLAATVLLALAGPVAVGGWMFHGEGIAPDVSRLDPLKGFGRMFSVNGLVELLKAVAKASALGVVGAILIGSQMGEFSALLSQPLTGAVASALKLLAIDALAFAAVLGGIAAIDVPYVIWSHRRELRMSLEEVRREQKELEGDPQLKARVRSLQRENARRRMMSEVPKADVVVTNPTHFAVAIAYRDASMRAPRVVAKGAGEVAARIREVAASHGVPLLEAPPLARALHRHVELGAEVPATLYQAVAQVLAWVFQLRVARATGALPPNEPDAIDVPADLDPGVAA